MATIIKLPQKGKQHTYWHVRAAARVWQFVRSEPMIYVWFMLLWLLTIELLCFVVFGFHTTLESTWLTVSYPFRHPDVTWKFFRVCAMIVLGLVVFFPFLALMVWLDGQQPKGPSFEIENFRDRSPYGDANLAQKREIARALQSTTVTVTPKFED